MGRLAAFQDIETAVVEESNPGLHSTKIPGSRVGKLWPESVPRAGPPAVTIGSVAARHDRVKGLDEHMALGLYIARQGVKQMLYRLFSNQGKITDDRVEPLCPKPTGGNILIGTDLKPSPPSRCASAISSGTTSIPTTSIPRSTSARTSQPSPQPTSSTRRGVRLVTAWTMAWSVTSVRLSISWFWTAFTQGRAFVCHEVTICLSLNSGMYLPGCSRGEVNSPLPIKTTLAYRPLLVHPGASHPTAGHWLRKYPAGADTNSGRPGCPRTEP